MKEESKVIAYGNGGSMHTGEAATRRFALITLKSALKLEMAGIRVRAGCSALAAAKSITGLRTNKRETHIIKLSIMIGELEKSITFVKEGA